MILLEDSFMRYILCGTDEAVSQGIAFQVWGTPKRRQSMDCFTKFTDMTGN